MGGVIVEFWPPFSVSATEVEFWHEFDKRLSTLDDVQSEIECDLPNEELDADIEAAANFRDNVRECRMAAGKLLRDMSAANKPPQYADGDASSVCGSVSNSSHDSRRLRRAYRN